MNTELSERLNAFREEREAIRVAVSKRLKPRGVVRVNCDRYRGFGIYIGVFHEDPTLVLVRIGNGNEWAYPAESVEPAESNLLPASDRLTHLRLFGIQCAGASHHRTLKGKLP